MGILKKLGLIEEVQVDTGSYEDTDISYEEEVNTPGKIAAQTFIEDVFKENGLEDLACSIYKVEGLVNSLPKEMVTATKKSSVLSALGVFGLTAEEVTEDGRKRMDTLSAAYSNVEKNADEKIEEHNNKIESLKEEIAHLEGEISDMEEVKAKVKEVVDTECNRIEALVSIVGG